MENVKKKAVNKLNETTGIEIPEMDGDPVKTYGPASTGRKPVVGEVRRANDIPVLRDEIVPNVLSEIKTRLRE